METRDERGAAMEPRLQGVWAANEQARRRQIREDACRPLAVNLAEGLALSEFLSIFTGSARQR